MESLNEEELLELLEIDRTSPAPTTAEISRKTTSSDGSVHDDLDMEKEQDDLPLPAVIDGETSGDEVLEPEASKIDMNERLPLSEIMAEKKREAWRALGDSSDEELLDIAPNSFSPTKDTSSDDGSAQYQSAKKVTQTKQKKEKKKKLPSRREREETMKKITSQTQRLQRERRIAIPYHKPQQLTLDAFLQRHKNPPNANLLQQTSGTEKVENISSARNTVKTNIQKHTPNLRKIDYKPELSIEEQFLKNATMNSTDKKESIDLHDGDDDDDEMLRHAEIKKIDDMIGVSPSKPKSQIRSWLENAPSEEGIEDLLNVGEKGEEKNEGKSLESAEEDRNIIDDLVCNDIEQALQKSVTDESVHGSSVIPNMLETTKNISTEVQDLNIQQSQTKENDSADILSSDVATSVYSVDINTESSVENSKVEKPVQGRKSIRDLLQSLPNYKKIAQLKPMLKKDNNENFIEFSLNSPLSKMKQSKDKVSKSSIQNLMDRFIKHSAVPKKPKEEHFNIHFTKKVEDSQGLEHDVTENVEYIAHNDIAVDEIGGTRSISSPQGTTPPGSRYRTLQEQLLGRIRAQRTKDYEEKVKQHAIYNEEICPEDKEAEEEILEDDVLSSSSGESEPDETDEEALQEYLNEKDKKKKKGRKLEFADDEAEEDDVDHGDSGENVIDIDDSENSDDDDDYQALNSSDQGSESEPELITLDDDETQEENIQPPTRRSKVLRIVDSDEEDEVRIEKIVDPSKNQGQNANENFIMSSNDAAYKEHLTENTIHKESVDPMEVEDVDDIEDFSERNELGMDSNSEAQDSIPLESDSFFQLKDTTPELSLNSLGHRRIQLKPVYDSCPSLISPLQLTRTDADLDSILKEMSNKSNDSISKVAEKSIDEELPEDITKLINTNKKFAPPQTTASPTFTQDDAMLGLCSGRFPTQAPETPQETQYTDFNFSQCADDNENSISVSKSKSSLLSPTFGTPVNKDNTPCANNETPKNTERNSTSRVLFRDQEKKDFVDSSKEDESDDEVEKPDEAPLKTKKNYTRIHMSLSESEDEFADDNIIKFPERNNDNDDSEQSETDWSDEEDEQNEFENEELKKFKSFKTKSGKIRRDFVENEAELSGSEVNSSDEDERDLDCDAEDLLNDEEGLDEEVVRAQVERAHLKQLIDDDQRQVRILQDMYLEDGDLHGDGNVRQRQFRWKNLDMTDDDARMNGLDLTIEDEVDLRWQQEKLEKIKWMKENSHLQEPEENDDESHTSLIPNGNDKSQSWSLRKNTMRRVQTFVSFSHESNSILNEGSSSSKIHSNVSKVFTITTEEEEEKGVKYNSFSDISIIGKKTTLNHDSPSPQTPMSKQRKRSFFKLGSPTLNKLAELNKSCELSLAGTKTNSRNFVFSVRSPSEKSSLTPADPGEEHRNKRKAKCPTKFQPKKIAKVDNKSVSGKSNSKSSTSVFKWINAM